MSNAIEREATLYQVQAEVPMQIHSSGSVVETDVDALKRQKGKKALFAEVEKEKEEPETEPVAVATPMVAILVAAATSLAKTST
ncbi:hypothetical protein ACLOJK_027212 [Asimina triloba]